MGLAFAKGTTMLVDRIVSRIQTAVRGNSAELHNRRLLADTLAASEITEGIFFVGMQDECQDFFGTRSPSTVSVNAAGKTFRVHVEPVVTNPCDVHYRRCAADSLQTEFAAIFERARQLASPVLLLLSKAFSPYFPITQTLTMPFQRDAMTVCFCFDYLPRDDSAHSIFSDVLHVIHANHNIDKGDYLEFGVYFGKSILTAYHAFHSLFPQMRYFGFDTFGGIQGSLAEESYFFAPDEYFCNEQSFAQSLRYGMAAKDMVIPIKGDLTKHSTEILHAHGIRKCLCAHIDVDVYRPAKAALNLLSGVLEQGSILLFDDYYSLSCSNSLGERRALREWLEENPQFSIEVYRHYGPTQVAFVVHKN